MKLKIKIYRGLLDTVIDLESGKELTFETVYNDSQDIDLYIAEI